MKKLMMVAAASVAAWCSWGAQRISVKEVANHYPWDGKVDCVFTLSGMVLGKGYLYDGVFELSVKKNGETIRRVVTNDVTVVDGTYTNTFDCTALFGAGYYPNGGISVELVRKLDGVQLWANGPYFAKYNVGATQPEDAGYYFWWGDTVGYQRNAGDTGWISVKTGAAFTFTGSNCSTFGKDVTWLRNNGWIDANSHLETAHDAARIHWGETWRIVTDEELQKIVDTSYCTHTWTNNWNGTGVAGCVVKGVQSGYTDKSIFLPVGGYGDGSAINYRDSECHYTSSTPYTGWSGSAWLLYCTKNEFRRGTMDNPYGRTVRPVRSAQ